MLDLLTFYAPPLSFALGGAVGGALYLLRQWSKGYPIKRGEFVSRPVFGALAAVALTVGLSLPNHFTSLMAGYFGIDIWDALAARYEPRFMLGQHGQPPKP